jgi:hypothetical protein
MRLIFSDMRAQPATRSPDVVGEYPPFAPVRAPWAEPLRNPGTAWVGWGKLCWLSRPEPRTDALPGGPAVLLAYVGSSCLGAGDAAHQRIHRKTVAWRNCWSAVCAALIAVPNLQSIVLSHQSVFLSHQSAFAARRFFRLALLPLRVSPTPVAAAWDWIPGDEAYARIDQRYGHLCLQFVAQFSHSSTIAWLIRPDLSSTKQVVPELLQQTGSACGTSGSRELCRSRVPDERTARLQAIGVGAIDPSLSSAKGGARHRTANTIERTGRPAHAVRISPAEGNAGAKECRPITSGCTGCIATKDWR